MIRAALATVLLGGLAMAETIPSPPSTPTGGAVDTVQGVAIADPYRWLEDQNSPETRAWIRSQIEYTSSVLDKLPGRDAIRQRLERLARVEYSSLPAQGGNRFFFLRRTPEENQARLFMAEGADGTPVLLVDPNPMNKDHTTAVSLMDVSRDGRMIAYGLRQGGEDETTMTFLDTDTRTELTDRFPRGRYFSVRITPDRKRVYYSTFSTTAGPRIRVHTFGTDPSGDAEIFGEGYGKDYIIGADLSDSGRYLIYDVNKGAGGKTEIFAQDVAAHGPVVPVAKGIDAEFHAELAGDRLYLHTNWKAPNWHVYTVDLEHPEPERWTEILPETKAVMSGFSAVGGTLAASYLDNVRSRVEIYTPGGKPLRTIALPGIGTAEAPRGRWGSPEGFYSFSSFLAPPAIYRYDMKAGKQALWFRAKAGLDPAVYETRQLWYASQDGTKVPMFVVAKKGLKLDGSHPTLMFAYGGFNISLTPAYSPLAAAFVEKGGVYAQPNLRGGGEFGEKWHEAGMLDRKQHVFDDFYAAGETLIKLGYTSRQHLAAEGRSNGGLLMGAAMTQRPDLFRAIVCGFPLLDMVRYDRFKVARWWVPEYGSADDPQQFRTLYAYSPYHHVKKGGKYPAILFVSGDFDTRVDPLHARKMTALMQASTGSGLPVLLHYDTAAGHSGGLPVSREIDLMTDEISFLDWQLGVKP